MTLVISWNYPIGRLAIHEVCIATALVDGVPKLSGVAWSVSPSDVASGSMDSGRFRVQALKAGNFSVSANLGIAVSAGTVVPDPVPPVVIPPVVVPPPPPPPPPPPVSSYSKNSLHWKHKRQQRTDFVYHYLPHPDQTQAQVDADQQYMASVMDQIMGGVRSTWIRFNPTMIQGPYVLLMFATIAGSIAAMNQWTNFGGTAITDAQSDATLYAAAQGFSVEELFLHYYDGQTKFGKGKAVSAVTQLSPARLVVHGHLFNTGDRVELVQHEGLPNADTTNKTSFGQTGGIRDGNYTAKVIDADTIELDVDASKLIAATGKTWGTISNQLGNGQKTFENRRTVTDSFGTHWPINPGSQYAAAYHNYRLASAFHGSDFIFGDVMDSASQTVGFNSPLNPPMASAEYQTRGLTLAQTSVVTDKFMSDYKDLIGAIRAANDGKRIQANISAYTFHADFLLASWCGAAQLEQGVAQRASNGLSAFRNWVNSLMNAGVQIVMTEGTTYKDCAGAEPHAYSSGSMRWKSTFYCYYLMVVPSDPSLCFYDDANGYWGDLQRPFYTKICEAEIGFATELASVQTITVNGLTDKVWMRNFENGLAVGRWPGDYTAGRNGPADNVNILLPAAPTGKAFYRVLDDGIPSATPSTSVDLYRIEGAVFLLGPAK